MRHRLLIFVVVATGVLVGFTSTAAVYVVNEQRDRQITRVQAFEAWARYNTALQACIRGNVLRIRINGLTGADPVERIPLVDCNAFVPKPTVPRPKESA